MDGDLSLERIGEWTFVDFGARLGLMKKVGLIRMIHGRWVFSLIQNCEDVLRDQVEPCDDTDDGSGPAEFWYGAAGYACICVEAGDEETEMVEEGSLRR